MLEATREVHSLFEFLAFYAEKLSSSSNKHAFRITCVVGSYTCSSIIAMAPVEDTPAFHVPLTPGPSKPFRLVVMSKRLDESRDHPMKIGWHEEARTKLISSQEPLIEGVVMVVAATTTSNGHKIR